jgi:putative hydrolase of the HAD superfamily
MPVRALMVDVDGVLITHPNGRRWDSDLMPDLGIDPVLLHERFFRPHFDDVVLGRADLFERLEVVMPALGSASATELVEYWFSHDARLDQRLLDDLDQVAARGMDLHLATVQERHRARYLWETLDLRSHFVAMHYAADIGYRKSDPEFYRAVEERTGLPPAAHYLIDDSEQNIEIAHEVGWRGEVWRQGIRLADLAEAWNVDD